MDALQMLREDHRKMRELFRQFEDAQGTAMKRSIADTALVELNIHSVLEEEIFYPAMRRQGNASEMVRRAEEEHKTVEKLMDELMKMDASDLTFEAKFHVLYENVKTHMDEEEAEMMPQAAEAGMARLERLGEQMAERKQALLHGGNGSTPSRRRASVSGTRTRRTSSTSGTRRKSSGTRLRTAASGTRASTARAKSPAKSTATRAKTTASRAKTTAKRTVSQAGTRARTTK
jgi:hemerythrin superfamily protein